MEQPNKDIENFQKETYAKFRQDIENFYDQPDSDFSEIAKSDEARRVLGGPEAELHRAKSIKAHGIYKAFHKAGLSDLQVEELEKVWDDTFFKAK